MIDELVCLVLYQYCYNVNNESGGRIKHGLLGFIYIPLL